MKGLRISECGLRIDEGNASFNLPQPVFQSAIRNPHSAFLLVFLFASLCACASRAVAQGQATPTPTNAKVRPRGSITGRVVGEDGQPVAGARVFALATRGGGYEGGSDVTGTDGAFKIDNLAQSPYGVFVNSPGNFTPSYLGYERGERVFYHPGDSVTLRVVRGGVITGRVTDARGEPAAGVRVNLVRVRTLEGRPVREFNRQMRLLERTTDDRGVYRGYGLLPGAYVVSAGGRFAATLVYGVSAHTEEAPTFYPSTTRDATAEVTVRAGEEVGGVDIRLRGDRGHAVSGTVEGVAEPAHAEQATHISVIASGSTDYAGQAYFYGRSESDAFSIDGLTDGDYELLAERYSTAKGWTRVAASTRRVQVRGADVTGLKITFAPLGSISGRMLFEAPPAAAETCKGSADALWSGAAVLARSGSGAAAPVGQSSMLEDSPDDKGEFAFRGVMAGAYRLEFKLGEGYFVTGVRRGARAAEADASFVSLKQGEQVSDLVVTAAYGAASIKGRVSFPECQACAPARARLYLVPQERERADDALRYAEATIERKGRETEFAFGGLAPGRYILLAAPEPPRAKTGAEQTAFADADVRARLRRDAEARGARVTLAPCERAEGVAVTYAEKQSGER